MYKSWIHKLYEFVYYTNPCNIWICFIVFYAVCTLMSFLCVLTQVTHWWSWQKEANGELPHLKMQRIGNYRHPLWVQNFSVCDIVSECLFICNQNFDWRVHFNCMAVSDEDWMLWNFYDKEHDYMDISNQLSKFHDVHHVWVKTFSEQQFLKCDCLLYER